MAQKCENSTPGKPLVLMPSACLRVDTAGRPGASSTKRGVAARLEMASVTFPEMREECDDRFGEIGAYSLRRRQVDGHNRTDRSPLFNHQSIGRCDFLPSSSPSEAVKNV
jgi:hypothetical protein